MITPKQIAREIERLYEEVKINAYYKNTTLDNNPLHLQVNADLMIGNLTIIKNLISLYVNAMIQENQKDSKITRI